MDRRKIMNELFLAYDRQSGRLAGSGASWAGQASGIYLQLQGAMDQWLTEDNSKPLLGVIEIMQTMNILSSSEADKFKDLIIISSSINKKGK